MSVFVDNMQAPYGRMKMCHMFADTHDELVAMADKIGVQRKWIQKEGTTREHFDIALSKRALAIQHGAQSVTARDLVNHVRRLEGKPSLDELRQARESRLRVEA